MSTKVFGRIPAWVLGLITLCLATGFVTGYSLHRVETIQRLRLARDARIDFEACAIRNTAAALALLRMDRSKDAIRPLEGSLDFHILELSELQRENPDPVVERSLQVGKIYRTWYPSQIEFQNRVNAALNFVPDPAPNPECNAPYCVLDRNRRQAVARAASK